MNQPQVAVIGAGYWGINLVRNFHALGALRVACDSSAQRLQEIQQKHASVAVTGDSTEVLNDPGIMAVVIATPAETHFAVARAALLANKDVFVEKPLALQYADAQELVALARERGRILMVGHLLEYHPAVVHLRKMIVGGELGKLQYIYSNRLNLGKIRREENILWSFAPHDIAVILRLVSEQPLEVTATGGTYLQPNIFDTTISTLLFDNGVRAHIFVSWLHPFKEQRLVVIGSKKMATFIDSAKTNKLMLYDQKVEWVGGQPVAEKKEGVPVEFPADEPLKLECQHFLDCIATRSNPLTDGQSGLRVLRVLAACQQSLVTNGQPIRLTSDPATPHE